jgi:hypothetical protein
MHDRDPKILSVTPLPRLPRSHDTPVASRAPGRSAPGLSGGGLGEGRFRLQEGARLELRSRAHPGGRWSEYQEQPGREFELRINREPLAPPPGPVRDRANLRPDPAADPERLKGTLPTLAQDIKVRG